MPLTIIMMLTCIINAIYYENYVSFASFSLLSTASFLGDMDGAVVTSLIQIKDVLLIFPIIVLPIIHTVLKKKKYYEKDIVKGSILATFGQKYIDQINTTFNNART